MQLRFDAAHSPGLPDAVRERLMALAGRRMTQDGVLVLIARQFRTQDRNRADARERLVALIREAGPAAGQALCDPADAGKQAAAAGRQGDPGGGEEGPGAANGGLGGREGVPYCGASATSSGRPVSSCRSTRLT